MFLRGVSRGRGGFGSARYLTIVRAIIREVLARELATNFQLCGHKWLIFSLATTTVSDTPLTVNSDRVSGGHFRTACTTFMLVETFADVASRTIFLFSRNARETICGN